MPLVLGAYVAYLVHTIVDWDWEIASVTLVAVLAAAALCATGATGAAVRLGRRARLAAAGLAAVAGATGLYGIATQTALSRIDGTPAHAAREARRAADLQPWSTEPWRRLAAVDATARSYPAARAALRKALASDAGDWSLWLALAQASDGSERTTAMAHVARLNPKSPELAAFRRTLVSLSGIEGAR